MTELPPHHDVERAMLLASLEEQRRHVLGIIDDLDDDALRRPALPSGWSIVGLIQHLIVDEEWFWFGAIVAGEQRVIDLIAEFPDAWKVEADVRPAVVIDRYRTAIEQSNEIIARTPLDAAPAWWPGDLFGEWRLDSLREVLLHMIAEIACHAGHLDAARELIDGRQWMVLTD